MTPEAQRVAIAELRGWTVDKRGVWTDTSGTERGGPWRLPAYLNDRNAMHEAITALSDDQKDAFSAFLVAITKWDRSKYSVFQIAAASLDQLAEAYLRATGKWVES